MMSRKAKVLLGLAVGVSAGALTLTFTYYKILYKPIIHVQQMIEMIIAGQSSVFNSPPDFSALPSVVQPLAQYVYSLGGYQFPTNSKYAKESNLEDLTQYFLGYDLYNSGFKISALSSNAKAIANLLSNNLVQDTTSFNPQAAKTALYAALSASVSLGDSINPSTDQMKAYQSMNQPGYVFHVVQQYTRMAVVHALVNNVLKQEAIVSELENNIRTNQCQALKFYKATKHYHPDYNSVGPLFYEPVTSRQDVQRHDLVAYIKEFRRMECFKLYAMLAQAQLQVINDEARIISVANQYEQLNLQEKAAIGK